MGMGHMKESTSNSDYPLRLSHPQEDAKSKYPKMVVHMPTTDSPGKSNKSDMSIQEDGGGRGERIGGKSTGKKPHSNPNPNRRNNDDDRSVNDMSTIGGGSSIASAMSKAIPYDLVENSFASNKRKNLGEVSWYYSDARVCEKCYRCYSDLDQRRKQVEHKLLELRRAASNEAVIHPFILHSVSNPLSCVSPFFVPPPLPLQKQLSRI